jgi:hypothetical protein
MATSKPVISTSFSYETLEETLDVKPQGTQLEIGIPKEIAFQENRIALTPDAVGVLVSNTTVLLLNTMLAKAVIIKTKIIVKLEQNFIQPCRCF